MMVTCARLSSVTSWSYFGGCRCTAVGDIGGDDGGEEAVSGLKQRNVGDAVLGDGVPFLAWPFGITRGAIGRPLPPLLVLLLLHN